MNRISAWREAARRRRDERDVNVHPDAGTLPTHHARPKEVRGGREALAQIDAELAPTGPAAAGPVYALETARWARVQIERNLGEAADLHTRAMECLELERALLERNVDLRAFLRVGSPAEFTPGTHQAPAATAVDEDQAAEQKPAYSTVGECFTCGKWSGTRWRFNATAYRMVPTCPGCSVTAPMTEEEAAQACRAAVAAAPRAGDTLVDLQMRGGPTALSQPADTLLDVDAFADTSAVASEWWRRPLTNGDVDDTLSELRALDGAR